ncbi:SPOR domain-containing protein [Dyella silvae]|uniref:SPOR domain-containing protein n=1 Tax=Dyella silvae TaxID=2994424 RepID=UPI0022646002|nr:SPOR domain-containing protein [Dyella silvae]
MKTRLLGAAVLIALAVLFVPMFFSSNPPATGGDESVSLAIPPAPDRDLQTKTMSLTPGAAPASTVAPASKPAVSVPTPAANATPVGSPDQLATVNIGSNRPRDVETDPQAGQKPEPTTVTKPGSSAAQPMIPAQTKGAAAAATAAAKQAASSPAIPAPSQSTAPPATAAHGQYSINLSAYASTASAQSLIQRVRALGYPASGRSISQAGKQLTMVTAGPFESRAAAEAARLKITQTIPGAPARLEGSATTPAQDDAPAATTAAAAPARTGGWAVQVAAMGTQADANVLRDKLRANGFDGYVDTVNANGKQLWRVRAGPQTQRADAVRIRDQIKTKLGVDGNVVTAP